MNESTYNIVIRGVQGFEQTGRAPSASKDHDRLLFWVKGQLSTRVPIALRNEVEEPGTTEYCDKGCTAENLEEITPS
jgi:hypothetical protein